MIPTPTLASDLLARIGKFVASVDASRQYSPATLRSYETALRQFFAGAGELTNETVRAYVSRLQNQGSAPTTIAVRLAALRRYAKWEGKPIAVRSPKIRRRLCDEAVPSDADYAKLLAVLARKKDLRHYLYAKLLGTSGLRFSELRQLRWCHILDGEVVLPGKGGKYRQIYFAESLMREVWEYVTERDLPLNQHVAMGKGGTRLTNRTLDEILKTAGMRAGIDRRKLHPHALRHYFAKRYLAASGGDLAGLADLLGHERLDTTMIYVQPTSSERRKAYREAVIW